MLLVLDLAQKQVAAYKAIEQLADSSRIMHNYHAQLPYEGISASCNPSA